MLNIILFGAPGCGKGTQAARIKEKYNINHISTGDVIRGEISRGTELGKSMQSYIESGALAPDSIVIGPYPGRGRLERKRNGIYGCTRGGARKAYPSAW